MLSVNSLTWLHSLSIIYHLHKSRTLLEPFLDLTWNGSIILSTNEDSSIPVLICGNIHTFTQSCVGISGVADGREHIQWWGARDTSVRVRVWCLVSVCGGWVHVRGEDSIVVGCCHHVNLVKSLFICKNNYFLTLKASLHYGSYDNYFYYVKSFIVIPNNL